MQFFVTGTGTDVGKTYVSAGLAWQICQNRQKNFLYIKPVASGVDKTNTDVEEVLSTIKKFPFAKAEGWFAYKEPASPFIAANAEDKIVLYDDILKRAKLLSNSDVDILMEGAGGIFVPLTKNKMVVDLMVNLKWPIVLVAHYGLGTVNHTCLTIEALKERNCKVAGIILNHTEKIDKEEFSLAAATNQSEIERLTGIEVFGTIKYGDKADSPTFSNIWQRLSKHF